MRQKRLIRLLVYANSAEEADLLGLVLREAGYALRPRHVDAVNGFERALREPGWDMILYVGDPEEEAFERCMSLVSRSDEDIPLIAVVDEKAAPGTEAHAVALRRGASDVVLRGNRVHMQHAVRREIGNLDARRKLARVHIALRECERRCKALADSSRDAIAFVGRGVHLYANREYLRRFGWASPEELEGKPVGGIIAPKERLPFTEYLNTFAIHAGEPEVIEVAAMRVGGEEFTVNFELAHASFDEKPCVQIQIIADTLHRQLQRPASAAQSTRVAAADPKPTPSLPKNGGAAREAPRNVPVTSKERDPLTELYTADRLRSAVEEAITLAVRERVRSALMYVDIDNFRDIMTLVGPARAKQLLVDTAANIAVAVPPEDLPARIDESSFGVLLKRKDTEFATALAERISKDITSKRWESAGRMLNTSCHVGVTPITGRQTNPDEVLENAYAAARDARRGGNSSVQVYQRELEDPAHLEGTRHLTREILDALNHHRMSLVYQPIVRLSGEPQELYEVFLRMQNQFGADIPTSAIFPAAAEHRFVTVLDEWVIANALQVLGKRLQGGHGTNFFIKLSSEAIKDENLLLNLTKHMKNHQVSGEHLIIEISESTALGNPGAARAFLRGLKQLKCRAALEHFGTGITSMKLVDELPVDYLKIDASVIGELRKDPGALTTLQRIIEVAHGAGKLTIAECLEDAESMVLLFDAGVDFAQGFYIQEPTPEMDFNFSDQVESMA